MIKVKEVSKNFEDFVALDNITCNISDGCIYGMVGSNGAGKSTFLRVLAGIYKPEKGEAYIDDAPIYENPKIKENVVLVADELFFLPGTNMNKMAKLYASIYEKFDWERFNKLTELFELNPAKPIGNFSKGMKRQAAIILALSTRAKYMFFDETFDGLDPVMRNLVKKLICNDVIEYNATVIVTSHSLRELEDICDHLALLNRGGLVLDSDVLELKTSQFKIQVAFRNEFSRSTSRTSGFNLLSFSTVVSLSPLIIILATEPSCLYLIKLNPLVLDVLPLTLEEVFTYEMEALGYEFDTALEVELDGQY